VFPEGICVETRDSVGVRSFLLYRSDSALISGFVMDFMKKNEILVLVWGGTFQIIHDTII
jgi:hypothetical protein